MAAVMYHGARKAGLLHHRGEHGVDGHGAKKAEDADGDVDEVLPGWRVSKMKGEG